MWPFKRRCESRYVKQNRDKYGYINIPEKLYRCERNEHDTNQHWQTNRYDEIVRWKTEEQMDS